MVMSLSRAAKRSVRLAWCTAAFASWAVTLAACGDSQKDTSNQNVDGGSLPVATGGMGAGTSGGGTGGNGALDAAVGATGGSGGTLAVVDSGTGVDASMPDTAVPPPDPPPADNARAVHFVIEREGELVVARVVPAEGFVGPATDALPVDPSDVEDDPVLWARDEGPRLVVDVGDAGVYASEGDGWLRLDEDLPVGNYEERLLDVTPAVDRVLLMKRAYDMTTFAYMLGGGLFALDGSEIYVRTEPQNQSSPYGVFNADGSLLAVNEQSMAGQWQTVVLRTEDGAERAVIPLWNQVLALMDGSLITGNAGYPQWYGFDGMPLAAMDLEPLTANNWRFLRIGRDAYGVIDPPTVVPMTDAAVPELSRLYRLESDGPVESHALPQGMQGESVLGLTADRLVGLVTSPREDRGYLVADREGGTLEAFAPAASVVEEAGDIMDVDEWERRPVARAWHVGETQIAVALQVTHTFWRENFGVKAAVSEDLWIIDADGARVERVAQLPGDDTENQVTQRGFTEDGAHYVWMQGDNVFAVALDDFERVELASAF
jgi:hypothetical protein